MTLHCLGCECCHVLLCRSRISESPLPCCRCPTSFLVSLSGAGDVIPEDNACDTVQTAYIGAKISSVSFAGSISKLAFCEGVLLIPSLHQPLRYRHTLPSANTSEAYPSSNFCLWWCCSETYLHSAGPPHHSGHLNHCQTWSTQHHTPITHGS